MDKLGQRIINDQAEINHLRSEARRLEQRAKGMRDQADELERVLQLARMTSHS